MRDITLEDTFPHEFTTRAFATGIPTTLGGTPVLSVLEGGNATPITAGVSLSVDRASVTGLNEATIVATAANGYEAGKSYAIYISTGTVGGVSVVGEIVGLFTVGAAASYLGSAAHANIVSQYDGTGLTGDNFPATQSQLGGIANVGSAVHRPALSYTLTVGTQSANTVAETAPLDGTRHEHTDVGGSIDLYYEFNIGAGLPSSVKVTGYVTGNNDDLDVYGYDWVAAAWVQIGNIQGGALASDAVNSFDMFVDMVGSGVDTGTVRVQFFKASGLTSALLAIDQIFVAYSLGADTTNAIWFDSGASNTNTVPGVDGTPRNPVSTEAAVNTLLDKSNLSRVEVGLDSSITFTTAHTSEIWTGPHWTLALGGQDVGGSHFIGADMSGVGTGASVIELRQSNIGTVTLHQFHAHGCGLSGTITFGEAGDYIISNGHSRIAGDSTPIVDFGAAIGDVSLSMPDYHNGIELRNLNATGADKFSISGIGQIIYAASSSGTVNQRGKWKETNTGGVTIIRDDDTANVIDILADTNELQTDWTDGGRLDDLLDAANEGTGQMVESYAANGVAPTRAQASFAMHQMLMQFGISGTALTVRKLDDTTTAFIVTLDDSGSPTDAKRV